MFPPFDQTSAAQVLSQICSAINEGSIILQRCAPPSDGRDTSSVMAGVLVCKKTDETVQNLITLSGISCTLKGDLPGLFVEPIATPAKVEEALSQNDKEIHEITDLINKGVPETTELKKRRSVLCDQSLRKVFDLYEFCCADKKHIKMMDFLKKLPPTGTGDCCAPKLLSFAFENSLIPVSMAEAKISFDVLSGNCECVSAGSGGKAVAPAMERKRNHGHSGGFSRNALNINLIPPCDTRCALILPQILGLEILYRDSSIIVVNKQSGLLSVPGRGPDKQDCIVNRVKRLFPECIEQPSVHRLDMETSGVMVLAFTKEAHRELNRQFENRETQKSYTALLDGVLVKKGIADEGEMELFFRLDVDNRPHQIWDRENGKSAVTQWHVQRVETYTAADNTKRPSTRVTFIPHTGRTHQLRLAAADSHGFDTPIIGDTLYGKCAPGERLMLHATDLTFRHPVSGEVMHFHSDPPF